MPAWTPKDSRQQQTLRRLRLVGEGPAAYFIDACRLMGEDLELDTRTHLVSHLLRELESALLGVLRPMVPEDDWPENVDHAHALRIEAMCDALRVPPEDELRGAWRGYGTQLATRAHRSGLAAPRPMNQEFRELWDQGQAVLAAVSGRIEASYAEALPRIEELAQGAPDVKSFGKVMLHSTVALDHFYDLAGVEWLAPLRDKRYFASPPPLVANEEGNYEYPRWPPGRFLARIANHASQTVIEIGRELDTDNPEAHESLVDAACSVSAPEAAALVEAIERWLRTPIQWALPLKVRDLIVHLIDGGEVEAGLTLMGALTRSPQAIRDDDLAGEHVAWLVPQVFPGAGIPGLQLAVDLLLGQMGSEGAATHSNIWRPDIASERTRDDRDQLVSSVRDAAEALAGDGVALAEIVAVLEGTGLQICKRLSLDLLSRHPETNLSAAHLVDREVLEDFSYWREYRALAAVTFGSLDKGVQEQLLGWISEAKQHEGNPERQRLWQLQALEALGDSLTGAWLTKREELNDEIGPLGEEQIPFRAASYSGSISPLGVDELKAMEVTEAIDFLADWEPGEDGWKVPTREGLARTLEDVIAADPATFASAAGSFDGVDPTYVRALFGGLRKAIDADRHFDWGPVLELAEAIKSRPREAAQSGLGPADRDPDWSWSWQESLDLIIAGLASGEGKIDKNLREQVWAILEFHIESEDPAISIAAEENRDPESLALNSVRCKALRASLRLAGRDREDDPDGGLRPEMTAVLERRLDPEIEPSAAVRSEFGSYFQTLVFCDEAWARDHVSAIFPLDAETRLWRAAWNGYVQRASPAPILFELLGAQYQRAVEEITPAKSEDQLNDPDEALVANLMSHYLLGAIEFDDSGGLLNRFYALASTERRAQAIFVIGTGLDNFSPLKGEVLSRLEGLAERRLAAVEAGSEAEELEGFAWWFHSGQFEAKWSLEYLRRLLRAGDSVQPDHLVAERVAKLSGAYPLEAVEIVQLMVEGAARSWFVVGARESIEVVLRDGLDASGQAASRARDLINIIVARGNTEFAELLPDDGSP
jgi:hypothetical protein